MTGKSTWVRELPEIGKRHVDRADQIEAEKIELLATLNRVYAREAALWVEIGAAGEWSRKQMMDALLKIDPAVLPFLPD